MKLTRLEQVNVRLTQAGDSFLHSLARHCPRLQSLKVFGCDCITDTGVALINAKHFPQLRELSVSALKNVSFNGFLGLAAQLPPTLKVLYMEFLHIDVYNEQLLTRLFHSCALSHLFMLNLDHDVTGATAQFVCKQPSMRNFDLTGTGTYHWSLDQQPLLSAAAKELIHRLNSDSYRRGNRSLVDWFSGVPIARTAWQRSDPFVEWGNYPGMHALDKEVDEEEALLDAYMEASGR